MMSVHITSLPEWITTIIIIIVMMQPMKMAPITMKTAEPMKMAPVPTQPTKTEPDTPLHPLPTIFQRIKNTLQRVTIM